MAEFRLSNFTSGTALTAAELNTGLTYANYTPTWTQSVAIDKTVDWARFTQFGKLVHVSVKMTATSAGTSNNSILIGLPVTANSNNFIMGWGFFNLEFPLLAIYNSATTVSFRAVTTDNPNNTGLTAAPTNLNVAIAIGGVYYMNLTYEAA